MARLHYSSFDEAEKIIRGVLDLLWDRLPKDPSDLVIPLRDIEDALSDMEGLIIKKDKEIAGLESDVANLQDEKSDLETQLEGLGEL